MRKIGIIMFGVACLALAGCEDRDAAREALLDAGYSDVTFQEPPFWPTGCGEHDWYRTYFHAKGPTGRDVKGVVCSGTWKGETIRLFH